MLTLTATATAALPVPLEPVASPVGDVSSLFGRFVQFLDVAPKTAATYGRAVRQFGQWLAENGIRRPGKEDVRTYRDHLRETLQPGTVKAYVSAVKAFFAWTEEEGLYPNVAARVKAGKIDKAPKKDALTAGEVRAVLEASKGAAVVDLRDYAILAVLFAAGLRAVEVRRLDVQDLASKGGVAGLYVQGKGHLEKDAFVPLAPQAETAVRLYLAARGPVSPSDPLFASTSNNSRGGRLSTVSISCLVKAAFRRAGIDSPRKTCHSTRHSFCTLSLLAGKSIREVAQFARHTDTKTTEIYAHDLEILSNRCGETVANLIF